MKDINSKLVNATKWSAITEVVTKFIMPITNIILARILTPDAFGVIATVTMIVSFVDILTDSGFQKYLIQHEFNSNCEKYQYANVAFWTNFIFSLLLWLIIALFSGKIAYFVGNPGLGIVITIACMQLPITSFSSIQMSLFKRDFDFKSLFIVRIITAGIPLVISVPLAIFGLDYWALIIGTIISQLFNAIYLTVKSKWKPKMNYNFSILKRMFSFSSWSLIESISIWLTTWVDTFIIGSILNAYYLGLYKTSTVMVNGLLAVITTSTAPVLFSALSRLQHDNVKFQSVFYKMQKFVSIFIFPIAIGVYLYRDMVTQLLLGNQWMEASFVIGHWALTSGVTIVFGHYCSEVYRAKGRPKLSTLAQILHLIVLIPVCLIAGNYGFVSLVLARSWIRLQSIIVHFLLIKYFIGFSIYKIMRNVSLPAFSALTMGFVGFYLQQLNDGYMWSFISIVVCVFVYIVLISLSSSVRKDFYNVIKIGRRHGG